MLLSSLITRTNPGTFAWQPTGHRQGDGRGHYHRVNDHAFACTNSIAQATITGRRSNLPGPGNRVRALECATSVVYSPGRMATSTTASSNAINGRPAIGRPVAPGRGRLRPLGLTEVEVTGGFWARRQEVNAAATLAHCQEWMEKLGWVGNFQAAVEGRLPRDRRGREFADSDVYKLMEAMAWEVGRSGSSDADFRFRGLTEIIAPAQEDDGYLNTCFGRPGQGARYSDLEWGHELYCFGHLFQAAVARARTTGPDEFVAMALRAADHVCDVFGDGGIERVGGHPEVEMGLVELGRLTGQQRYLDQAAMFVNRRGHHTLADIEMGRVYFQDDIPVREATAFRGHAVRALYLASGVVDVAVETGDDELLAATILQWENTVARRTYLTGGMGSHHVGEAFGEDFVLPPDRAYSETCAGVASVMLAWRLLLATGEARFADLIERTLYNVVATSPSPDGRTFFYANPLHQRVRGAEPAKDHESRRAGTGLRAPWFSVSCCPTNVARTMASLGGYLATSDEEGLQLHQYADSRIRTTISDGRRVGIDVTTDYPNAGDVTVKVAESDGAPWTLSLRVPHWATGSTLVSPDGSRSVGPGTAVVERVFTVGDEVTLHLPVGPRWTSPDPRIDATRGTVAVERGPLVMCVESVDLPEGQDVGPLRVDPSVAPALVGSSVQVAGRLVDELESEWPYRAGTSGEEDAGKSIQVPLIEYHDWANRGPATMRVWLPIAGDST